MSSIIQDWAADLGLRHQGVLVAAIRGCDSAPREDASKWLVRFYRGCLLRAHCGDVKKARSFMIWTEDEGEFWGHVGEFFKSIDHYPQHWLFHFMQAAHIMGRKMPGDQGDWWLAFYHRFVCKLHLNPESEEQMDRRLGADEKTFAAAQA